MKKTFKLADGTIGTLDTDSGEFTPNPEGTNDAPLANTPEAKQLAEHPAPGLGHEDPIRDVLVGNAVAKGLPLLLQAAGGKLAGAGANATTRLAAKAAEDEAARLAAQAADHIPVSPMKRLATFAKEPLKHTVDAAASAGEHMADRALASPAAQRMAAAAMSAGPKVTGATWLLNLLGHVGGSPYGSPASSNPLYDTVPGGTQ